jgi:hypothetical protein
LLTITNVLLGSVASIFRMEELPEDGGSRFFRNVSNGLPDYMA